MSTTYYDDFKSNCADIIANFSTTETVKANKLVSLAISIGTKYPFVFLPDFLHDFMTGMFTSTIQSKYCLYSKDFANLVNSTLKLNGRRSKGLKSNNMVLNLRDPQWKQQYDVVMSQSRIFEANLVDMLNYHTLRAFFVHAILNSQYMSNRDIAGKVLDMYGKVKDQGQFPGAIKPDLFEEYLNRDLDYKLHSIIGELSRENLIVSQDGDVSLPMKYSNIIEYGQATVDSMKDGMSHNSLRTKILNEFPLLKAIFISNIIDEIFHELETHHNIVRKRTFWKYSPDADQLFTRDNYNAKVKRMNKQLVSRGRTKFFGRNITPDRFIDELKNLELGDFDDLDDQVTRMAGLILSDSVQLQSPREEMPEFDFIVDLTHYNFRPEQEELMKKLDFRATANLFHCKIMIDEKITKKILKKLRGVIPNGEQGVVFTCIPVDDSVLRQANSDRIVQIINEDGIHDWCSITPIIPCRLHSIAKVMYGESVGKMVLIKSLSYESGLATVESIPDRMEITFEIGRLQEIDLHVSNSIDLKSASEEYIDFCALLAESYNDSFDGITNTSIIDVYHSWRDLHKNMRPDLYNRSCPKSPFDHADKHFKYVKFDNSVYVTINLNEHTSEPFVCMCGHHLNEEYHRTLCKHMVAAIMHICVDKLDWPATSRIIKRLKHHLINFQESNIQRSVFAIRDAMEPKSRYLLKEYLQKYADDD